MSTTTNHLTGSCHCGAVRYDVEYDLEKGASRCNCTICAKIAATGAIVKPAAFRLLAGDDALSTYEWGHKVSKRFFCKHCGIHVFARGHLEVLGGDYVSVNFNTLDGVDLRDVKIGHWDGRHDGWDKGMKLEPWPLEPAASNASA
ncbi:MAG TPA: GFA family protein [Minicystis sp.]|nr:GFA family protein [Minicystis sp.]